MSATGAADAQSFLFPPVGIVHLIDDLGDLVAHRLDGVTHLEIMAAAQPNGPPHIGTVSMLMCAFAVADHLSARLELPARVIFDVLDNGPAEQREIDGVTYQLALRDAVAQGASRSEQNLLLFRDVLSRLRERTEIEVEERSYFDFQAEPAFRRVLLALLRNAGGLAPIVSPAHDHLRLRLRCPSCCWMDKDAVSTGWELREDGSALLTGSCHVHGAYEARLAEHGGDYVDANTPLRSVVKAATLIERERSAPVLTVSVDGSDWSGVWLSRIVVEGLGRLGYGAADLPSQMFAPLLLDWSGAKLSKSLYVGPEAYSYLPLGLTDFRDFVRIHGEVGFDRLWDEVRGWARDPRRFFRSYSLQYIGEVLDGRAAVT